jgi:hypothetical protein
MQVAENVWRTWNEREAETRKPSIALLLTADVAPETARDALAEAVHEAMRPRIAKADAASPDEEEFRAGYCSFTRAPEGVLLRIDEGPDDFEGLLRGIADGLRARGIEGRFDVYKPEGVLEIPELIDLFECHLRLEGARETIPPRGKLFWQATPTALEKAVEAGVAWCRENGPGLSLSLNVSLLPPVTLSPEADLKRYVLGGIEAAGRVGVVYLTSAAPDRFRTFTVKRYDGRAGLIEGGSAAADDWQSSVRRLTEALRAAADWAVYGFVKRGSRRMDAILGSSLPSDWLDVPHMNALFSERFSLEDTYVPDAFGVQLLSGGHAGNIPSGPNWRVERLASGRVLVEHVDLAAWFDGSLVRFGGHGNPYHNPFPRPPQFLTRAREDLDTLLYKDGRPPAYANELGDSRFLKP